MSENTGENTSLASLRKHSKKNAVLEWLNKHTPWLTNWKSLFWFFVFIFLLGIAWMGYSVFFNSGTQLYGWDYSSQFTQLGYDFWDCWHTFFTTGEFVYYDSQTFLGVDNIGSNTYYGLFDPFLFLTNLFPRSAVPQVLAFATCLKGAVGALAMRAYLKYMGVSEASSRVGGTAFAYCGFLNFMVGFPNFVSMCFTIPLIFLGIEKVLKERKPSTLIWSVFLLGIICFFFLVVACIFGVLYALWRYFWTLKSRNAKQNWSALGMGIASFGLGIMLCSWVLLPSLRQSSLSGRTVSIGAAYWNSITTAFKGQDFGTIFGRLFEMVGDNQARELMGLVSFFYPTVNYLWLPLYNDPGSWTYDSWISSLFVYTPMVIFFISSLISSVRKKDWEHLISFAICCYFTFTTFAYFFFYAFSGDGYGRWFIVLVPLIICQACRGIDDIKDSPKYQLTLATLLTAVGTILTYVITNVLLNGKSFTNPNGLSYFHYLYQVPASVNGKSLMWIVYYQMALVVVEGIVIILCQNKKSLHKILIGFISVETIVCGNCSFVYGSSYSYNCDYNGGYGSVCHYNGSQTTFKPTAVNLQDAVNKAKEDDPSDFYRIYQDGSFEKNISDAMGFNGASFFHSLYNYDLSDFARNSHIISNDSTGTSYGQKVTSKTWAGYYSNKRSAFDLTMGFRYYIIKNEGYPDGYWEDDSKLYNVPFGSECVYRNDQFRVYKSPYYIPLGHAVDDVYRLGKVANSTTANRTAFYENNSDVNGYLEIMRNEQVYLHGAIVNDDAVVSDEFTISSTPSYVDSLSDFTCLSNNVLGYTYKCETGYGYHPSDPSSFLRDYSPNNGPVSSGFISGLVYDADDGKMVWKCNSTSGYFNDDPTGAYFLLGFPYAGTSSCTRIYMIGDTYDESGTLLATDQLLNYEYNAISNDFVSGTSPSYNGLFGFYAPGKVKYIVFATKGSNTGISFTPFLYRQERSNYEANYAKLTSNEYALQDVKYVSSNEFTFKTNYSKSRFVVTGLGYDEGWSAVATSKGSSGEDVSTPVSMYRLDGGLVGFVAPQGEVTYTLKYETPHLKTGIVLASIALIIYFGFEVTVFVLDVRKRQKELGLDWNGDKVSSDSNNKPIS
jgi:uncharacterized membrane protein YfhO